MDAVYDLTGLIGTGNNTMGKCTVRFYHTKYTVKKKKKKKNNLHLPIVYIVFFVHYFLSSLKIHLQLWACIVPPSAKALIKPHQSCITLFSTPPRSGTDQFGSNCQDEVKPTKVIQDDRNSPADSMTLTLLTSSLSTPPAVRPTVNYTCSGIGR